MLWSFVFSTLLISGLDPYHFEKNAKNVQIIIDASLSQDKDPFELLAMAVTESNLNEKAVSDTGDYGLFQINCRVWWKKLGYKSLNHCHRALLDPYVNTRSALFIIELYQNKYNHCKKDGLYFCYNGGPYWKRSVNKKRIQRYQKKVCERKRLIRKKYKNIVQETLAGNYHLTKRVCYDMVGRQSFKRDANYIF